MTHIYIEITEKNLKQLYMKNYCSVRLKYIKKKEVKIHKAELSEYVLDTKGVNGKHHLLLGSR